MRTTDYKPNTCSDKQIVNMNRNVHTESVTSASSFRCVFQAIQHCSSAVHCSAKYASELDSAQGWPYKARFDFRIGSFMSTTQSKWSKDAGKPHQVAFSTKRALASLLTYISMPRNSVQSTQHNNATRHALCKSTGAAYNAMHPSSQPFSHQLL